MAMTAIGISLTSEPEAPVLEVLEFLADIVGTFAAVNGMFRAPSRQRRRDASQVFSPLIRLLRGLPPRYRIFAHPWQSLLLA
jgi:hypothetical protein